MSLPHLDLSKEMDTEYNSATFQIKTSKSRAQREDTIKAEGKFDL